MAIKRNFSRFQISLKPKQIESLRNITSHIEEEYTVRFSVSEIIRDAIDQFISQIDDDESLKTYMELKGW
jgi:metal-responsive CopG/Arc/MetJ family transcriptional regulator